MNARLLKHLIAIGTLASCLSCGRPEDFRVASGPGEHASVAARPEPQEHDRELLNDGNAAPGAVPTFSRDISPLLDRYCASCHDSTAARGGVVLDALGDGPPDRRQKSLMTRMARNLRSESMPPAGEPQPTASELETLNSWLDSASIDESTGDERLAVRRLNRAEYNNTVRDLIGLDVRPADEFPADDVGSGFDNVGAVLSTSPILLEMYLGAADTVIDEAFRIPLVRHALLNPPVDTVPLAFRKFRPAVRSPREDKVFRAAGAAPDPDLARQQQIYDILRAFCDRAFRRPATHDELTRLLAIVLAAESDGEPALSAMKLALRTVLVSPQFLFLGAERDHDSGHPSDGVPDHDFELATRLSYFLWSSMPDEGLYRMALQGALRRGDNLRAQVKRMLRDRRSRALAENFAGQWLETRKLKDFTPDPIAFPDFDEPLRAAMVEETVLFFESIRDKDRSVLELLDADYTFVNERLALHYRIPGIKGDWFRRVSLKGTPRGGVMTQASVLAATSNPTRTSPVKRGKWILDNILGAPPEPPPSGVEALKEGQHAGAPITLRQKMSRHRTDPACASCHSQMDPLGFGLENFDAIGGWRSLEEGQPIDSNGRLPGGRHFTGPAQLKAALLARRGAFARCLTEKLLTYALGRGLERADRREVDRIARRARPPRLSVFGPGHGRGRERAVPASPIFHQDRGQTMIPQRLSRRTALRGLGVSVALPLLEAMRPAPLFARPGDRGLKSPPLRMAFLYVPNGVHMPAWVPRPDGARFTLPAILEPLLAVKDDLVVLSGLSLRPACALGDGGGDHARAMASFLTGCHPRKTDSADLCAGVSVDQAAAGRIGQATRFPSLEIGCEGGKSAGECDHGYSCAYQSNLSWRNETTPVAKEINPRLVFDRLFDNSPGGKGGADAARRDRRRKSILDAIGEDARRLRAVVGTADRRKLDEYLTGVRELEARITRNRPVLDLGIAKFPRPLGIPADYQEHVRLMGDLLVLAFQIDVTRIATFVFANDGSNRSYPGAGVSDGHHDLSHHGGDVAKEEKIKRINRFHAAQLAYILGKMKQIPEGDGNLLDHAMIVYGSGISDGNSHSHDDLPILLAGKGNGTITTGRHLRYPAATPLANLYVSLLDRMGVTVDGFGDSTGRLTSLEG